MSKPITAKRLAEIKARSEAAHNAPEVVRTHAGVAEPPEVTTFLGSSWRDIPSLVATLERAVGLLRRHHIEASRGISCLSTMHDTEEFVKEFDHE